MTVTATDRHTRSYLLKLFAQHGLNPRHDLGQNFLIDLNVIDFIIREAELNALDVVLEVGAGTGSLTKAMAPRAGEVVSVELDRNLHVLAGAAVAGFSNVTLVQCDALQNKNRLNPAMRTQVERALAAAPGRRLKLVANLPYGVATPVISNLVATDLRWERMVVTIQYELAQRILARPRTGDYGALSVWLQAQCRVKLLRRLPPSVFWPRPKVDSAIVRLTPDVEARERITDRAFFHDYVRRVFLHRRKHLRRVLTEMYADRLERPDVTPILHALRLSESARAEELDVGTHVALSGWLLLAITVREDPGSRETAG